MGTRAPLPKKRAAPRSPRERPCVQAPHLHRDVDHWILLFMTTERRKRAEFPRCFRTLVVKIEKTNSNSTRDFSKRIIFTRVDLFVWSTLVVKIKKTQESTPSVQSILGEHNFTTVVSLSPSSKFPLSFTLSFTVKFQIYCIRHLCVKFPNNRKRECVVYWYSIFEI